MPDKWQVYFQDNNGQWQPVTGADDYPTKKGAACTVNFNQIKTKAVKLEFKQPEQFSCGIFEWSVK